jgi:uncharacterized repeat protein (TIGR03803 family)
MTNSMDHRGEASDVPSRAATAGLYTMAILFCAVIAAKPAQAQTFTVLHTFAGGETDGENPYAGLIRDNAGNLYGTTLNGGWRVPGHGTVFKLDTAGALTTLHTFDHRGDGIKPYGGLVRDRAGNLYGMTPWGIGRKAGNGIIYRIETTGKEAIPHRFTGGSDGGNPHGGLIRDQAGNLYGGTEIGGTHGCGVLFDVNNGVESVLYTFTGSEVNGDGCSSAGDLVRDQTSGDLYGTTSFGGNQPGCGTVFKLDSTGKETILHAFNCLNGTDGSNPAAGLILDQAGNLYGTTTHSRPTGMGTVFRIDTTGDNYSILYTFSGGADGSTPMGPVVMDTAGNLYGTTRYGGNLSCGHSGEGCGVAFELKTTGEEIVLHAFSGPDGMAPSSGLVLDAAGNLYGTAPRGGNTACAGGCGVVFKITSR